MIASVAALHNRLKTNATGTVFVCTFDNHVNRTQIEISCFATHHKFQLSWCLIASLFVCAKCKAVNNNRREGRRRRANNINNTLSESFVWKCRKNLFSKNIGFFLSFVSYVPIHHNNFCTFPIWQLNAFQQKNGVFWVWTESWHHSN